MKFKASKYDQSLNPPEPVRRCYRIKVKKIYIYYMEVAAVDEQEALAKGKDIVMNIDIAEDDFDVTAELEN